MRGSWEGPGELGWGPSSGAAVLSLAPECRRPVKLWRRLGKGRSCLQLTVECLRVFERFGWELFPEVVLQPRILASLTL